MGLLLLRYGFWSDWTPSAPVGRPRVLSERLIASRCRQEQIVSAYDVVASEQWRQASVTDEGMRRAHDVVGGERVVFDDVDHEDLERT